LPWEETDGYVRSGHERPDKYDKDSMRTIDIDSAKGIKAVIGCPKGNFKGAKCSVGTEVQSFMFAKEKGWTMTKGRLGLRSQRKKRRRRDSLFSSFSK